MVCEQWCVCLALSCACGCAGPGGRHTATSWPSGDLLVLPARGPYLCNTIRFDREKNYISLPNTKPRARHRQHTRARASSSCIRSSIASCRHEVRVTSDHGDVCYRSDMWAKWVLHFIMSTIDFQGFQVLTVSESQNFPRRAPPTWCHGRNGFVTVGSRAPAALRAAC